MLSNSRTYISEHTSHMTKQIGFSLIEALVALVILSAVFATTWGWFNTAVRNTTSIENAIRLPVLFDEFTEKLNLVNLKNTRNGVIKLENFEIYWSATENRSSLREYYRKQPQWIVVLFDINAEVKLQNKVVTEFSIQQLAQWRDPNYIDFSGADF